MHRSGTSLVARLLERCGLFVGWRNYPRTCENPFFVDLSGAPDEMLEIHRDAYSESRAEADPLTLVCVHAYGVASDLEPGDASLERLERWEALGFDEAIVRAGPLDGREGQAVERIRFLSGAESGVH